MKPLVKGLEKLTAVRLAEVLTERGTVSAEVITDALYAQDKNGEPFAQVLVSGGHITEWDLAKLVTENFQLPFLMASNYQISEDAKKRLPKELLFRHQIVPLDLFGDIVCIAMPVMIPFDAMMRIQKETNCELFPYVGLISENKKVIGEMFKDFPQWLEEDQKRREKEAAKRSQSKGGGDWMSIFDAGDQAIQETLTKKPSSPAAPAAAPAPAAKPAPKPPPPKK